MILTRWLAAVVLLSGLSLFVVEQRLTLVGCAPAPRAGEWVSISDEAALIVWDAKSHTEHFVRRANFKTGANDFGFLVPTPTQPDLDEVADGLFDQISKLTEARFVYEEKIKTVFGFSDFSSWAGPPLPKAAAPPSVEVLHQQVVAGFDAVVLRADDAQALAKWLNTHGYETRPALANWLRWYVEHHWIITAFKLTKLGTNVDHVETNSIRMSFNTEHPFYPYREPEDMRRPDNSASRTLRVYFLADQKYAGTLGESNTWPGEIIWANNVAGDVPKLISLIQLSNHDETANLDGVRYLTEFQDVSSPRLGLDELYFRPAADQSPKERLPNVMTNYKIQFWPGPWGLVVLPALILSGFLLMKYRRDHVDPRNPKLPAEHTP